MTTEYTPRTFRHTRVLRMRTATYERALTLLAASATTGTAVTAIVGIANGGTAPAQRLHQLLGIPCFQVAARHNATNAAYTQATGHVHVDPEPLLGALAPQLLAGTILLVDDICGSGATYRAVLAALQPHLRPDTTIRTVCLCRNVAATFTPDLWVWDVDDWVSFPWEPLPHVSTPIEALPEPDEVHAS